MDLDLEIQLSKLPLIQEAESLKNQVDNMRPLPDDIEKRVMQKLRLDWNYNSNAIEGNKLDYGETVAFLMTGITAKGKPLKDHLDIRGHNEAINFLMSLVKDERPISEADIRALHQMILVEPYEVKAQTEDGLPTSKWIQLGKCKTSVNHVKTATGETHYYATPEEVPIKIKELIDWYDAVSNDQLIHPIVLAALFHHRFVAIHPFDDGNGRLTRILMNLILMRNGFPPAVIKNSDKQNYYFNLSQADSKNDVPFVEYISERIISSLNIYVKAITGANIDEDEDVDKEITLLRMQLRGDVSVKEKRSKDVIDRIFRDDLLQLIFQISAKLEAFREFFFEAKEVICINYESLTGPVLKSNNLSFFDFEIFKEISENWGNDILDLSIHFSYSEYKNPEKNLIIELNFQIVFNDYNYSILFNNEEIVRKAYHIRTDITDYNILIKALIQDFKAKVKESNF
ncbi:Fic family protein [Mucilaginibacter sp.]